MLKFKTLRYIPHWRLFCVGLFPLYTLVTPSSVNAGCVSSDINTQYIIGSHQTYSSPTQTNNFDVQYGENCLGNSSHSNNFQLYSETEPVQQTRERNVYLDSGIENSLPILNTPNVDANINQQLYLPVLPY